MRAFRKLFQFRLNYRLAERESSRAHAAHRIWNPVSSTIVSFVLVCSTFWSTSISSFFVWLSSTFVGGLTIMKWCILVRVDKFLRKLAVFFFCLFLTMLHVDWHFCSKGLTPEEKLLSRTLYLTLTQFPLLLAIVVLKLCNRKRCNSEGSCYE